MRELVHENLGRLLPAIFRDFRKTPTKTRIGRCAFSVRSFPRRGIFRGTPLSKCRAFTFPAKAAGMRQMECAYRKARLSDAQKLYYIHVFLGELTPAERRDFRKTPTKTRIKRCAFSVRSFPRLRAFSGHTYYKTRAAFTFPARAAGMRQMGCAYRKARLSDAQKLFYIHAFLGELTPAECRDFRKTPTKTRIKRCAFSVRGFPRCGIFRGTPL